MLLGGYFVTVMSLDAVLDIPYLMHGDTTKVIRPNHLMHQVQERVGKTFTYLQFRETVPRQGWKIHVSATIDNYEALLEVVSIVCHEHRFSFKYVNNQRDFEVFISKNMTPESVGKLITIYPVDTVEFHKACALLHEKTQTFQGVTVVTDRKYKNSNVIHYRYGVMNEHNPQLHNTLISPSGEQSKDVIGAYFTLPDFVEDPLFEEDTGVVDADELILNEVYRMNHIIKMSAGGNVYHATDVRSGSTVVIKEARNHVMVHAKLSVLDLLRNEVQILNRLSHTDLVPKCVDSFELEDAFYVVESYVEGVSLEAYAHRLNILAVDCEVQRQEVNSFALNCVIALKEYVERCHQAGLVLDDISSHNFIVDDAMHVTCIDFESSYFLSDARGIVRTMNPDFGIVPMQLCPFESDFYKLGIELMGMITGVQKLMKFDISGKKTIDTFVSLANLNQLNQEVVNHLLKFAYPIHKDGITNAKLSAKEKQALVDLETLRKSIFRAIVLNRKNFQLMSDDVFESWRTSKYLLKYHIFEDDAHQWVRKIQRMIEAPNFLAEPNALKKAQMIKIEMDLNPKDMFMHRKQLVSVMASITQEALASQENTLMLLSLSIMNDFIEADMDRAYWFEAFDAMVRNIATHRLMEHKGKVYLEHQSFATPYFSNGNAGFIHDLIRNMRLGNHKKYCAIMNQLADGVNHRFAKNIGVNHGLAGLALCNLELYQFTGDETYLMRCIHISKSISLYSFVEYGQTVIPSGDFETISYNFHDGLLGYYRLLDALKNIGDSYESVF